MESSPSRKSMPSNHVMNIKAKKSPENSENSVEELTSTISLKLSPQNKVIFKLSQFLMPSKTVLVMLMNSLMTPTLKVLPKKKYPLSSWKLSTLITMTPSDSANITFQINS